MMLGIIGGTGFYRMEGLKDLEEREVSSPFGRPSANIMLGKYEGIPVAFLPRHGKNHELLPSEINFRANVWALKSVGVTRLLSVSAVGSLAQEIPPGDLALVGQYFDWTRGKRASTFFGDGLIGHVSTAQPTCSNLSKEILDVAGKTNISIHPPRTYGCVEGPRFGTKAESFFLQKAGCHLVGMTNVPEAFLAREAQICYASIGVVTDYDCWMEDQTQHVSTETMIDIYRKNLKRVETLIQGWITGPGANPPESLCSCRNVLQGSLLTDISKLSGNLKKTVEVLLK